jgi:hypothetical protein
MFQLTWFEAVLTVVALCALVWLVKRMLGFLFRAIRTRSGTHDEGEREWDEIVLKEERR